MESLEREKTIQTTCLLILTALAIAFSLRHFSSVLIPFVLAVFLTFGLSSLIDVQVKWLKMPRFAAVVTTVILCCIFFLVIGLVVSAAVRQIIEHKDEYLAQTEQLFSKLISVVPLERFGYDVKDSSDFLNIPSKTAGKLFSNAAGEIVNILSNGILVLIYTIFMLVGKGASSPSNGGIRQDIESSVKKYTTTMILTSGLTGLLVGFILYLLKVDFAWMFGFFAFLLNFIPNIGSVIATLLPVPVVVLSSQLPMVSRILAILIPAAIQFTVGNIVQPKLMGRSLNLHPVVILLSLVFFGVVWGVIGMFLATPITGVVKIFLEKFEYTAPVADLLSGQNKKSPSK
ncbi:MAG: AI-2E family transporter [Phycisphaerales bacterium]|jgi:AI-2 transport protein TqsA